MKTKVISIDSTSGISQFKISGAGIMYVRFSTSKSCSGWSDWSVSALNNYPAIGSASANWRDFCLKYEVTEIEEEQD